MTNPLMSVIIRGRAVAILIHPERLEIEAMLAGLGRLVVAHPAIDLHGRVEI